jgi:hypothetical protein
LRLDRVGVTPFSPVFYLKTEAEPASETLFLKKKHWAMDEVQQQDFSKCITPSSEPLRIYHGSHFFSRKFDLKIATTMFVETLKHEQTRVINPESRS